MKAKPTKRETQQYIEFLEKRINSKNYKKNVPAEEFEKTKNKLAKERLKLKLLQIDIGSSPVGRGNCLENNWGIKALKGSNPFASATWCLTNIQKIVC